MRLNFALISTLLCIATSAHAEESIARLIPQAETVGDASLTFAFWDVYDATLYAPNGKFQLDAPFVLSLRYQMSFNGKDIAERSVQEMRGQGFRDEARLAAWQAEMERIFPDVYEGTVLSALFTPNGITKFYNGNQPIGIVKDAEFTRQFAAIWLGEKTSEPALRKKLLGMS